MIRFTTCLQSHQLQEWITTAMRYWLWMWLCVAAIESGWPCGWPSCLRLALRLAFRLARPVSQPVSQPIVRGWLVVSCHLKPTRLAYRLASGTTSSSFAMGMKRGGWRRSMISHPSATPGGEEQPPSSHPGWLLGISHPTATHARLGGCWVAAYYMPPRVADGWLILATRGCQVTDGCSIPDLACILQMIRRDLMMHVVDHG